MNIVFFMVQDFIEHFLFNNFFNILSVKTDFLHPNKIINLNIAFEFWLFYTGNPTLRNSLFRAV